MLPICLKWDWYNNLKLWQLTTELVAFTKSTYQRLHDHETNPSILVLWPLLLISLGRYRCWKTIPIPTGCSILSRRNLPSPSSWLSWTAAWSPPVQHPKVQSPTSEAETMPTKRTHDPKKLPEDVPGQMPMPMYQVLLLQSPLQVACLRLLLRRPWWVRRQCLAMLACDASCGSMTYWLVSIMSWHKLVELVVSPMRTCAIWRFTCWGPASFSLWRVRSCCRPRRTAKLFANGHHCDQLFLNMPCGTWFRLGICLCFYLLSLLPFFHHEVSGGRGLNLDGSDGSFPGTFILSLFKIKSVLHGVCGKCHLLYFLILKSLQVFKSLSLHCDALTGQTLFERNYQH